MIQEKDPYGFEVKIIADSLNPLNQSRLTTFQLRYPRFIHSEFMTHRVFSRNASSSRAIPVAKMIAQVRNEPAMPVHWGKNQKGMQAREELSGEAYGTAKQLWLDAAARAADYAEQMHALDLHKQVANRILEPFQFISVIVTATDWDNFFALRNHPDADPNIAHLAKAMQSVYNTHVPKHMDPSRDTPGAIYHLPYITPDDWVQVSDILTLAKMSAARCARVSYLTHDGKVPDVQEDLALFDRLVKASPPHMSPTEHQAKYVNPLTRAYASTYKGNLNLGWLQLRKFIEKDNMEAFINF